MKDIWVIANWKSNKTIAEATQWLDIVGPQISKRENLKVVVCPIFDALSEVKKTILVGNYPIIVGAQDVSPFETGAFTGEEPAKLLREVAQMVIVGHSERRESFGETDEIVAEKTQMAVEQKLTPIFCVQNEDTAVPSGVKLIAYEPIFAIGSGNPDTPDNANTVAGKLKEKYGQDIQVLYGGSVTSQNAKAFLQRENLNGLLVGKASLDADEFIKIVETALSI